MGSTGGEMKVESAQPLNNGSVFWNRLNTIPFVSNTIQTTVGIYSTSKERHALLGKGLGVIEYGVNVASVPVKKVATTIVEKYPVVPSTATKLDNLAVTCLDTIETKVPEIQKTPGKIVRNVKQGASVALHSSVRRALKTYPGQKMVGGLDAMIAWSQATIENSELDTSVQQDTSVQADEDIGVDELDVEKEKENQTVSRIPGAVLLRNGMVMLKNGMIIPLKVYLETLRMAKHMLANMAGVSTRPTLGSPRKPVDTTCRKKLSAQKRLQKKGLITRLTDTTKGMLGWKSQDGGSEVCLSPTKQEGSDEPLGARNEKRKLDDRSDDELSDTESLDLMSALYLDDPTHDPDYEPNEEESNESLEYTEGDTESDLEAEDAGESKRGRKLQRLKDNDQQQPIGQNSSTSGNILSEGASHPYDIHEDESDDTIVLLIFVLLLIPLILLSNCY